MAKLLTLMRSLASLLGPKPIALGRRCQWSLLCTLARWQLIEKATDHRWIDILADQGFKSSLREIRDLSVLDTARLANLWEWCGVTGEGSIVEVGAFRGGTSLHLSNRWPHRKIFICDTFEGFAQLDLDERLDSGIRADTWCNRDAAAVAALFEARERNAEVIKGIFPRSDSSGAIRDVSFAHIDVDIYQSCRDALDYLSQRSTPSAIFAINDYGRQKTRGVTQAVREFVAVNPDWMVIPAYPGQGVLFNPGRLALSKVRGGGAA